LEKDSKSLNFKNASAGFEELYLWRGVIDEQRAFTSWRHCV
jgi:hypothetical protein